MKLMSTGYQPNSNKQPQNKVSFQRALRGETLIKVLREMAHDEFRLTRANEILSNIIDPEFAGKDIGRGVRQAAAQTSLLGILRCKPEAERMAQKINKLSLNNKEKLIKKLEAKGVNPLAFELGGM